MKRFKNKIIFNTLDTIYCIYTDKEVSLDKTNIEHIIPLGLGGCNDFCISVDKNKNSELGSHIDGKLSNDFIISLMRKHKDLRGHSGNAPQTKLKKSKISATGKPIHVTFNKEKIIIYDLIQKRELLENETKGIEFSSTIKFEKSIRMLFTAKVILAAGYFVYGQTFRDFADHNSLRKLMNYKLTETDESIKNLPLRIVDPFHQIPEKDKGMHGIFKMICNATDSSCVIFLLSSENIIASVGVGGQYIGTINFKAKTEHFPNDDDYRLGHVLVVQDKKLKRTSFYHMTELLNDSLQKC